MLAFLLAGVAVAAASAICDLRTGLIPNRITLGALAVAPFAHLAHGLATAGPIAGALRFGAAIAGALLCGLIPYLAFRRGVLGGGDVKLFAALGALCLPLDGLDAQVHAFAVAALLAPLHLVYQGKLTATLRGALHVALNPLRRRENRVELPPELGTWFRLGPSIFVGVALVALGRSGLLR